MSYLVAWDSSTLAGETWVGSSAPVWVSAVEGCPLSGVPLHLVRATYWKRSTLRNGRGLTCETLVTSISWIAVPFAVRMNSVGRAFTETVLLGSIHTSVPLSFHIAVCVSPPRRQRSVLICGICKRPSGVDLDSLRDPCIPSLGYCQTCIQVSELRTNGHIGTDSLYAI